MSLGTRCIQGVVNQRCQTLSASHVTCLMGLRTHVVRLHGVKERQGKFVCANGITKSLPRESPPWGLKCQPCILCILRQCFLPSFYHFSYLYIFFSWRMPYVEHDRLAEESGESRSVLKDIRVLILMWTDRALSCCEPKDHRSWKTRWRSRHSYYRSQKCQYFQRQQQEFKNKGFQVKAKKYSWKCNACYFIELKRPTGLVLWVILVRGLGRIQCEVRVFMNEARLSSVFESQNSLS